MTEKQKRKLLNKLKHKSMTRKCINTCCGDKTVIESLCSEKVIEMVSEPCWKTGIFVPQEEDLFALSDKGKNYLAEYAKEQFQRYWSLVVPALSLIVSIIALIRSW